MLFALICKISRCRSRYLCLLHFILFAIHNLFCCLLQPVSRLQLQLAKQLISACSVAAASQLVAHSSSVALNIYDFFRAGCRGRVGVLQVDSLMATFNNYELQFFSVGCCLKKDSACGPHSVQRTHLKLALILCGVKNAAAAIAAAAAVPGMWPKKCGKQKTKTFTTKATAQQQ